MNRNHETLEDLLRLQRVAGELGKVEGALARIPKRIAEIEATLSGAEQALARARARHADGAREKRSLEQDIEVVKSAIAKHQDQLMQVKTNDQYRAMTREIANEKARIEAIEEKILLNLERQDEIGREVKTREADLAAEKKRVEAEKTDLGREQQALDAERTTLQAEQSQVISKLPPEALALFRRIAKIRGSAVARVENGSCGECRVRARPQPLAEARARERLVQCENCHRILYIEAVASVPAEPTPEQPIGD